MLKITLEMIYILYEMRDIYSADEVQNERNTDIYDVHHCLRGRTMNSLAHFSPTYRLHKPPRPGPAPHNADTSHLYI